MYKIAVYHQSVPSSKNQEKIDILKNFSIGISKTEDQKIDVLDHRYIPSDVAVIQGWVSKGPIISPHLRLRSEIILRQAASKKHVIVADSSLFLYSDLSNPFHYLRYSFNGVFPNTGNYCDSDIDPNRWKSISKNLNIQIKDYRNSGEHILICLQRNGGWSMGINDVQEWAMRTITTIRKYTNRPILIRPHPGDKKSKEIIKPGNPKCRIRFSKDIKLSANPNLLDDLKNCWAAVNYNSSPVVAAAIEGIPIFVCDPTKSQCRDIANTDFSQIENPLMPDRQIWVERLAMSHWNFDELRSGECWRHMRKYIL